jgi:hypothetical protein
MKNSITSPQTYARIGGALYLVIIATGMFGELFARGTLLVSGNAAATARERRQSFQVARALERHRLGLN